MEIEYKNTALSKLTIAKDEVRVKIGIDDTLNEYRIVPMAHEIVKKLSPVDNTYRG